MEIEILSRAITEFALDFFKKISEEDNGNIFYSPFSIYAALAMLKLGAGGNTATEISRVLHFSVPEPPQSGDSQQQMQVDFQQDDFEAVKVRFGQLIDDLNRNNPLYDLNIANGLFGEETYEFINDFLNEIKNFYKAELKTLDFRSSPGSAEASRIHINNWVEGQTNEKIKNLLPPDSVDSLTKMVLVNAIYFKGKWKSPFEEASTMNKVFRLPMDDSRTVEMMHQIGQFRIRSVYEENFKILELPYEGDDLSMFIILPNDIEGTAGLENLEGELTYDKFDEWTSEDGMEPTEVDVSLPRFKMELSYDLKPVLTSMGMVDAFDASNSDFSGMSEATNLAVSAVVHKAYVEVNEEGTEAAAATGVSVGTTSVSIRETFNADHPFLFVIKHKRTKTVLFAGRYSSPEET